MSQHFFFTTPLTRRCQLTRTLLPGLLSCLLVACSEGNNTTADSAIGQPDNENVVERDQGVTDQAPDGDQRPDIILVVADDMRWDIMSGRGHPYVQTPNLDLFASEAASMDNAFVPVPVCSPSRATILTGLEPHLASTPGIVWRNNSFLQTQRTFAEDLQDAGYTTAYIGKWHLGDGAKPKPGFDHWESFDWLGDFFDTEVHINGEPHQFTGYADDILSARAQRFLESQADSDKPVFLMVGLKAPHLQFEHPERYNDAFADVDVAKPDSYYEDFSISRKLQAVKDWLGMETFHCGLKCFNNDWSTYIKKHYRAILGLDDSVGTLRGAMSARGKEDNTLFIYTSDNGYTLGEHGLTEKHMLYEEPVRVPFLIDFPGREDRGYRFEGLVSTLDIAPTALDYAEAPIPYYMQGRSLKTLMDQSVSEDVKRAQWRDELFMFYSEWQVGVRTDRYKYIEALNAEGHIELYDLQEDPKELATVHDHPDYADVLINMQQRLTRLKQDNEWSPRLRTPVQRLLVSSPVSTSLAHEAAVAASFGSSDIPGLEKATGLTWQSVDRNGDRFDIGSNVPAEHSVLLALPIKRTVTWDPHVRIHLGSPFKDAMYVGGQKLWDDHERRPIDYANPPMVEVDTLTILKIDGSGEMSVGVGVEGPDGSLVLPLESNAALRSRVKVNDVLGLWGEDYMCGVNKVESM